MTTVLPETTTDIGPEVIEHLDFDPEFDCEHRNHVRKPWHDGPAAYFIAGNAPCGNCATVVEGTTMLCASAWTYWGGRGVLCIGCERVRPRDEIVKIVGAVK